MPSINTYITQLIEEKDLSTIDPTLSSSMKKEMEEKLHQLIIIRLINALEDSDAKIAYQYLKSSPDNQDKLIELIGQKLPDTNHIVSVALVDFRNTYQGI